MSISYGPNLGLMENANTGEAHDTALRALLRGLDGLVMPNVKGYLTNTPPGSPANGDLYIIGAAPTGAWAGQGGKVTRYSTVAAAYEFFTPKNGWMLQSASARESYRYTGSAWEIYYQEGTWTPTIIDAGGGATYTHSIQAGEYVLSGRLVTALLRCVISAIVGAPTGNLQISGLPFTVGAYNSYGHCFLGRVSNVTLVAGYTQVTASSQPGDTVIRVLCAGSTKALAGVSASGLSSTSELSGLASYQK